VERGLYLLLCDSVITAADPEGLLYTALAHNEITRLALARRVKPDERLLRAVPAEARARFMQLVADMPESIGEHHRDVRDGHFRS
jgi:hypothetical protein